MAEIETLAGERPGATLVGLTLVHVDITIADEAPKEEQSAFNYDAVLCVPERVSEHLYAFSADFSIHRKEAESGNHVASFTASYFCGMRVHGLSEYDPTEIAEGLVRTSVWISFCALAAISTGQMQMGFPNLPPAPNRLEIKSEERDDEAAMAPA